MKRILAIEDNKVDQLTLGAFLKDRYECLFANNYDEAMKVLNECGNGLSAIVTDIMLPGKDGFEIMKIIRENSDFFTIPIVVVTYYKDDESREKAMTYGADGFISKPYNKISLLQTIDNLVLIKESSAIADVIRRDDLTGLLDKQSFCIEAERMISKKPAGFYILSCSDINDFKIINDLYGNDKGNDVLKHLASCLNSSMIAVNGLAGRLSSDNFVSIFPATSKEAQVLYDYHKLATTPKCINHTIKIKVGRYLVNDLSTPIMIMIDRAFFAGESIRERHDFSIADYDKSMYEGIKNEQAIINSMESALFNKEFIPYFQPQYNHSTGALIGAEALVRWNKNGKILQPGSFIPTFEKNGYIYQIDLYMLEETCKLIRKWCDKSMNPLPVSINFSRKDFFHKNFVDIIIEIVNKYKIPYNLIRFEVTESAFSEINCIVVKIVNKLIALGFTVEIDDFGSGYSSLNTLKDVNAQILKLDMRFFENADDNERSGSIIESVVRMADMLDMSVIAEGVEEKIQADFLKTIGCYFIQGYFYSKPIPVDDYETILLSHNQDNQLAFINKSKYFNNSKFWNPKSMDTLIFNSYVGGACIFEYNNNNIHILRVNDQFVPVFHGLIKDDNKLFDFPLYDYLDDLNKEKFSKAIHTAIQSEAEQSFDLKFSIDNQTEFIKASLRTIASNNNIFLFYMVVYNKTEQVLLQARVAEHARKLEIILHNSVCGIIAFTIDGEKINVILCNDYFAEILGYDNNDNFQDILTSNIVQKDYEIFISKLHSIKKDGISRVIDFKAIGKNGKLKFLRANCSKTTMEGYGNEVIVSIITDVSDKHLLEDQCRALMDNIDGGITVTFIKNGKPEFLTYNETFLHLLGCDSFEEYTKIYPNKYETVHKDDRDRIIKQFETADGRKSNFSLDYRIVRKDGSIRYMHNNISIIKLINIEGPVQLSVIVDVTDKVELIQKNLELSSELYRIKNSLKDGIPFSESHNSPKNEEDNQIKLLDNLPSGAALYEYDGKNIKVIHINKSYWNLVNRKPVDYRDNSIFVALYHEDRQNVLDELDSAIRQKRDFSVNCRLLYGKDEYRPFNIMAKIVEKPDSTYNLFTTYTPLSSDEMALQDLISIALSTVMDSSTDLLFVKDKDLKFIGLSKSIIQLAGLSNVRDAIGKTSYELFPKSVINAIYKNETEVLATGKSKEHFIQKFVLNNSQIILDVSLYPLCDTRGNIFGIYGTSIDITHQIERESQLELLTKSIPGGLASFSVDKDEIKMLFFNDGFFSFSGLTREEYAKKMAINPLFFVIEEDRTKLTEIINTIFTQPDGHINSCDYRCHKKDGGYRWMSMKSILRKISDDKFIINIVQFDMTEQEEEREKLRISDQLNQIAIQQSENVIAIFEVETRTLKLTNNLPSIFTLPIIIHNIPEEQIKSGNISEDSVNVYRKMYNDIIDGIPSGKATYQLISSEGWRWIEARYTTVFSNTNKPITSVISFSDVTNKIEKEAIYNKWQQEIDEKSIPSYKLYCYNLSKNKNIGNEKGELLEFKVDPYRSFNECTLDFAKGKVFHDDLNNYLNFVNSDKMIADYYRNHRYDSIEFRRIIENGDYRWTRLGIELVEYPNSTDIEAYLLFEDIHEAKENEIATIKQAERDPLTGLLNRRTFENKVKDVLKTNDPYHLGALLILDIDCFKLVNDKFGHAAGDKVLIKIANTISSEIRNCDLGCRMGGDEFLIFLSNMPDKAPISKRTKNILDLIINSIDLDVKVSVSIGISIFPNDGTDFDSLYKKADIALYNIKNNGKGDFQFFEP